MSVPLYLDASAITARLSPAEAVDAIVQTLRSGFDPAHGPPRINVPTSRGHFLLMPSETGSVAGVKIATVAPDNPTNGSPRIQASYLLYDAQTLTLQAILDGTALTTLRTPAVSIAAVRTVLERFAQPIRVVVFGAGPQAIGHIDALAGVAPAPLASVTFILRRPTRAGRAVRERGTVVGIETAEATTAITGADVVVCATSARTPLFAGNLVAPGAVVIAVGSHEPDARELDSSLMARASVVVEDRATALREAGDVVLAVQEGALDPGDLIPMSDTASDGVTPPGDRPVVFKGVGMSWQDLSVASAVLARIDKDTLDGDTTTQDREVIRATQPSGS